jgi:hypothetical protein
MSSKLTHTNLLAWSIQNKSEEEKPAKVLEKIDTKWLDIIMGKPEAVRMKEIIEEIDESNSVPRIILLFDELEMLVESLDNANDLAPMKLWPMLLKQLKSTEPKVRKYTAWVIGTATQNNEKSQNEFGNNNGFQLILECLQNETEIKVLMKIIYCLSSCVRSNHSNFELFELNLGFFYLFNLLGNDQDLDRKCIFLLDHLVRDDTTFKKTIAHIVSENAMEKILGLLEDYLNNGSNEDLAGAVVQLVYNISLKSPKLVNQKNLLGLNSLKHKLNMSENVLDETIGMIDSLLGHAK